MIKYIGSKRTLLPTLVEILRGFPELESVADLFSGTSRVGHALKGAGFRVVANDHNAYAHCLARCYVEADREAVEAQAAPLLAELDALKGRPGYFTQTFCIDARFFQPHNGARVDAIRAAIERKRLPEPLRSVVLTSLMEAADRVDSTCGLQMAYVKKWAPRSEKRLTLRMPELLPAVPHGPCEALCMDANEAARVVQTDVAYLDPPYNQHSYLSNYHIWESLVRWDKPAVYGVARKRVDCRERKSRYNARREHRQAFEELVGALRSPLVIVSFNNEGYQSRLEMEQLLRRHGELFVITKDFKRYVGAQIGVYNPEGDRVGAVSHLRNEEYIYLLARPALSDRIPDALERLTRLAARVGDRVEPPPAATSGPDAAADRIVRVTHALAEGGPASEAELRAATGLSSYQTRKALDELCGRDQVRAEGTRSRRRYTLVVEVVAPEPVEDPGHAERQLALFE